MISELILITPTVGKPDTEVREIVSSPMATSAESVLAAAAKVTAPADVVVRIGVMSLYPPPSLM